MSLTVITRSSTDFKMTLLLMLVMVTACAADPQDLTGKMLTFPEKTNIAYARMITTTYAVTAVTVCHRTFTDVTREHVLFSMATPDNDNAFQIFWNATQQQMEVHTKGTRAEFSRRDYKPDRWHSICATWDSVTGLAQLWVDGQPSGRKFTVLGSTIRGPLISMLGQNQNAPSRLFDANQSFVGMMTDVHMWNYVLSPCEIHNYMERQKFTPGNVLNWGSAELLIFHRVLVEKQVFHRELWSENI